MRAFVRIGWEALPVSFAATVAQPCRTEFRTREIQERIIKLTEEPAEARDELEAVCGHAPSEPCEKRQQVRLDAAMSSGAEI